jgi:heme A synthase
MFVRLVGLTGLGVLLQAVTAGAFVSQDGRDSWVNVHGVIADVTWVLALITAVYAFRRVRPSGHRRLWAGAAALFVLLLAQTGLGHLITDGGMDGLIVVHVPVAMIIFGLVAWLSFAAATARRHGAAPAPYDADTAGRGAATEATAR